MSEGEREREREGVGGNSGKDMLRKGGMEERETEGGMEGWERWGRNKR